MDIARAVLLLIIGTLQVCLGHVGNEIVANEEKLMNTCTGTCDQITEVHDKLGCNMINECKTKSEGWNSGFVRCDYCSCQCEKDTDHRDTYESTRIMDVNEEELLGTCASKGCNIKGLVRNNFRDCEEVRDCYKDRQGYLDVFGGFTFHYCDYCKCSCVNHEFAQEYELTNMQYDLTAIDSDEGAPTALAQTVVENAGDNEQTTTRELSFTTTTTTTMETSHTTEVGLTVSVEATAGIGASGSVTAGVSTTLTQGFTYSSGSSESTTREDRVAAEITVPPRSSVKAIVTGRKMRIAVPYSADLVTTYEDGSTQTKPVTGVYTDVETTHFLVKYEDAEPL